MRASPFALVVAVLTVVTVACAGPQGQAAPGGEAAPSQSRTLVMAVRDEVTDLAPKIPGSSSPNITKRLFNAFLTLVDGTGTPRPYLAQALPQLNTESWRVLLDGRMETRYSLRDGLTWQDGAPLAAEDFAFAFRVYREPALGFIGNPEGLMEAVLAPDPRTIVIQWRSLYADAGTLGISGLVPLPRHLLEAPFAELEGGATREAFFGRPFWTVEYVGAGPYRLTRWEPGTQLEGEAFERHALGRPKIDRLVVRVFNDENTVLAAVLAGGQVDYTNQFTLRFEHMTVLKREWEAAGKGTISTGGSSSAISLHVQFRPDVVGDPALLDVRVRRAIAHTLDRQAVNEGVFEGLGAPTETLVPPTEPYYPDLDRVRMKYPLDPRRAEQLMGEAGFARSGGGPFADTSGRRFRLDFTVSSGPELERVQAILTDSWRRAGLDTYPGVLSQAEARERSSRHIFPGLASRGGGITERHFVASEIGSEATRWSGDNRSGWTHPEYERLWDAFNTSLDLAERRGYTVQMMTLVSEHLPVYPLHFSINPRTWVASLQGPEIGGSSGFGLSSPGGTIHWNVHEWEFR